MTHYEKYTAYCRMTKESLMNVWEQAKAQYESAAYFMQLEKYMLPNDITEREETEMDEAIEQKYMALLDEARETLKDVEAAMRANDMDEVVDEYEDSNPWKRICGKAREDAKEAK